jgi:ATP-binding cassette subfamily B protein
MRVRYTEAPATQRKDWHTLRGLYPYLWRYRGRVFTALAALVAAKAANVGVPLALKGIVDQLDLEQELLVLPLAFLLAYGALRLANTLFQELRDTIFARVRHGAERDQDWRYHPRY